jgi:hypothetical protein
LTVATTLAVTGLILAYIHTERKGTRGCEAMTDENGKRIRLPLTMLQVRALWALGIGTVTLMWIVAIFIERGVENYYISTLIVGGLFQALGILIGYRRF